MTNAPDNHRHDRRIKLAAAVLTGILAGATRTGLDWLLRQLTAH